MIREPTMRRIQLEIRAAPNDSLLEKGGLERTVHPGAATPVGRPGIPIRMVIEGNQDKGLLKLANP